MPAFLILAFLAAFMAWTLDGVKSKIERVSATAANYAARLLAQHQAAERIKKANPGDTGTISAHDIECEISNPGWARGLSSCNVTGSAPTYPSVRESFSWTDSNQYVVTVFEGTERIDPSLVLGAIYAKIGAMMTVGHLINDGGLQVRLETPQITFRTETCPPPTADPQGPHYQCQIMNQMISALIAAGAESGAAVIVTKM